MYYGAHRRKRFFPFKERLNKTSIAVYQKGAGGTSLMKKIESFQDGVRGMIPPHSINGQDNGGISHDLAEQLLQYAFGLESPGHDVLYNGRNAYIDDGGDAIRHSWYKLLLSQRKLFCERGAFPAVRDCFYPLEQPQVHPF
jgi:hypothetical protein